MLGDLIPTGVLATTWGVTREAHGAGLHGVRTDWCSLWSTEGWDWSEPRWDKVEMIRWDLALGMDHDTLYDLYWVSTSLLQLIGST